MHGLLTYNVPLPCILCFVNAREIKVDMTSDSADKNEIMTGEVRASVPVRQP